MSSQPPKLTDGVRLLALVLADVARLDYCVKFTVLDALTLDFDTVLIADCCRGVNLRPDDSRVAVAELQARGVKVLQAEQVASES